MMDFIKKQKPSTILYYSAFIYVFLLFAIFGVMAYDTVAEIKSTAKKYERDIVTQALEQKKEQLKNDINTKISILDTAYNNKIESTKNSLKTRIVDMRSLIEKYQNKNSNKLSKDELLQNVYDLLSTFVWGKDNYYFIVSKDGKIVSHPNSSIQGKTVNDFKKGDYELSVFENLKKIKDGDSKEGKFFEAPYYKPNSKEVEKKIYFASFYEPLGIYLITGEYDDNIKNQAKNEVSEVIENKKYTSQNDIIALYDKEGESIEPIIIKSLNKDKINDHLKLAELEIKEDIANRSKEGFIGSMEKGFLGYHKESDDSEMVFAKIIPLEDLKEFIKLQQADMQEALENELKIIIEIFSFLLLITALLSLGIGRFISSVFQSNSKKLEEKNSFLNTLTNNIEDLIIVIDSNYDIVDVNLSVELFEKRDKALFIGKNLSETNYLSFVSKIDENSVIWCGEESNKKCYSCRKIDISNGESKLFLIFCKNITDIIVKEELLKNQNEELSILNKKLVEKNKELTDIFDNSPNPIAIIDKEGFSQYINRAFKKLFCIENEEFGSLNISQLTRLEFKKLFLSKLSRAAAEGFVQEFDILMSSKSKGLINTKVSITKFSGSMTFVINIRDVSAEVIHTQNLEDIVRDEIEKREENELKFSTIFHSTPLGVAVIDDQGSIIEYNEGFNNIFAYQKDEVAMKKLTDILGYKGELSTLLESSNDFVTPKEFNTVTKNGEKLIINIVAKSIKLKDRNYKLILTTDITELTLSREKEKENEKMLIQQSRFAVMGEMLNMIAHQWRQPLGALSIEIINLIDNIQDGCDMTYVTRWEERTVSIIQHLSKTIDEFRTFFQQDKKLEFFNIKEACLNSYSLIEPILKQKNIETILDLKADMSYFGYQNRLQQALLNILSNAKDALEGSNNDDKKITFSSKVEGQNIEIEISDTAGGITIEPIERIFEPYFSTKNKNSSGIGLYMTKVIIIDQMHGNIRAYNRDNGAVFSITIPIKQGESFENHS